MPFRWSPIELQSNPGSRVDDRQIDSEHKESGKEAPTMGVHAIMDRQALGVAELPSREKDSDRQMSHSSIREVSRRCRAVGAERGKSGLKRIRRLRVQNRNLRDDGLNSPLFFAVRPHHEIPAQNPALSVGQVWVLRVGDVQLVGRLLRSQLGLAGGSFATMLLRVLRISCQLPDSVYNHIPFGMIGSSFDTSQKCQSPRLSLFRSGTAQ